jgi:putative CocE/NonD family hydrolase
MATILIDKDVMVAMRDGARLATDTYRMDGATPAPALLARTPHGKEGAVAAGDTLDILRAVQAGYAVVVQDVRGRFASEGEFDPMFQDSRDGVDAIAWAAAQPWSLGVVGTFGGSYLGATQWLPAREQPPALRAMAPSVTFSNMYEGSAYQGGAKVLHDLRWVVEAIPSSRQRPGAAPRGWMPPDGGTT